MARPARRPRSRPPAPRARLAAAFAVHLLTATGAVLALAALLAAVEARWTEMFIWLALALAIDGVDGALARHLKVADILPRWSGETLDLVVDYLTYVLVPAFAIATGALLPPAAAVPAAAAILIANALYFADKKMKTDDGYFRGFPALWNIVAFYLFLIRPDPYFALVLVALFVALTFAPIFFVHPLRAKRFASLNLVLLAAWAGLGIVALSYRLEPPAAVNLALLAIGFYFFAAGLVRAARARR
jgi:phosphatidylcholine synthase